MTSGGTSGLKIANFSATVLLNIMFATTIMTVLYWTYSVDVITQVIEWNTKIIADSLFSDISLALNPELKRTLVQVLQNPPTSSDQDADAIQTNAQLQSTTFKILGMFWGAGLSILFILKWFYPNIHLVQMLITVLLTVSGIACAELLFLSLIIRNYIIADPNAVKLGIFNTVKQIL